jgi:hypothetical protein
MEYTRRGSPPQEPAANFPGMEQHMPIKPGPWVPKNTLATRLRLVRQELGMSVEDIATLCEVPIPTWRNWEHGASPRRLDQQVRRISERTGVDLSWLMSGNR